MLKLGIMKITPPVSEDKSLRQVASDQLRSKIKAQETQIQLLEMQLALGKIEDKQRDIDNLVNETLEAYSRMDTPWNESFGEQRIVYNIACRDSEHVLIVTPNGIEAVSPTWHYN